MDRHQTLLLAHVAWGLALVTPAMAQVTEIEPGVQYEAGTRVGATSLGISLVVPADWVGVNPPGTELLVFGSETRPGMVVTMGDEVESMAGAVAMFGEPIPLDQGIVLQPVGAPRVEGREVVQSYTTQYQGQPYIGQAHGLVSEGGMGIAVVAIGPASESAYYRTLATTIAGTVRFVAPIATEATSGTSDRDWDQYLRGHKLHYLYTATGYTNEREIDLCVDGSFAKRGSGGGFGGGTPGASGAWQHGGVGRWSIGDGQLTLRYPTGETETYTLTWEDEKLHMNGERCFVVNTDRCN